MKIRQAEEADIEKVLNILDDFRTYVFNLNGNPQVSDSAKTKGRELYLTALKTNTYICFIALDDKEKVVGVITGNKSIVLRKGQYKLEIEEFFVSEDQHGKGVGSLLLDEIEQWGKGKDCSYVELISGYELEQAHKFYENKGYKFYGNGCKKDI